jgi:hypothetical protein
MVSNLILKFDLDANLVTYSSGRSLVFFKNEKVFQIYLSDKLFEKILYNLNLCKGIEGIIAHYNIHPKINTIEYERIEPIYNITTNTISVNNTFYSNVYTIIESFLRNRIVHGDFCCDNIGYSPKQKRYIVYDLETVRYMLNGEEDVDRNRLEKSIKFCTK